MTSGPVAIHTGMTQEEDARLCVTDPQRPLTQSTGFPPWCEPAHLLDGPHRRSPPNARMNRGLAMPDLFSEEHRRALPHLIRSASSSALKTFSIAERAPRGITVPRPWGVTPHSGARNAAQCFYRRSSRNCRLGGSVPRVVSGGCVCARCAALCGARRGAWVRAARWRGCVSGRGSCDRRWGRRSRRAARVVGR